MRRLEEVGTRLLTVLSLPVQVNALRLARLFQYLPRLEDFLYAPRLRVAREHCPSRWRRTGNRPRSQGEAVCSSLRSGLPASWNKRVWKSLFGVSRRRKLGFSSRLRSSRLSFTAACIPFCSIWHPAQIVRFVRVQWKMSRWSKRETMPMFGFYVYAEESGARVSAAVA